MSSGRYHLFGPAPGAPEKFGCLLKNPLPLGEEIN